MKPENSSAFELFLWSQYCTWPLWLIRRVWQVHGFKANGIATGVGDGIFAY
jgi:hypothetical protein